MKITNILKRIPLEIGDLIDQGYITERKHNDTDLYIFNYTDKCQYDRAWDNITMQCRGLIADGEGRIVARSLPKFFNLEEYEEKPKGNFEAYEKYDGSLGILYWLGEEPQIATRGSFHSTQADVANILLTEHDLSMLDRDYTYLFEIIFPENRIVVDYGKTKELVLLGAVKTSTGEFIKPDNLFWLGKRASKINIKDLADLEKMQLENKEGFVLHFEDGTMAKFKFADYVRLHRLLTGVTSRKIWELMKSDINLDEYLTNVPDEFYEWVKRERAKLEFQFSYIKESANLAYEKIKDEKPRKNFAEMGKLFFEPALMFQLLDGRDIDDKIWAMIKPEASYPFKVIE